MKKYQKLTVVYLCLCIGMLILGIVAFFVPSIGVIEKDTFIEARASISVFDFMSGDYEAYPEANIAGQELGTFYEEKVDVIQELFGEEKDFLKEFNAPMLFLIFLGIVVVIALVSMFCRYRKSSEKGKYIIRWGELMSATTCVPLVSMGILWMLSYLKLRMTGTIEPFNLTPIIVITSIFLVLVIASSIFLSIMKKDIKRQGDDFVPYLFAAPVVAEQPKAPQEPQEAKKLKEEVNKNDGTLDNIQIIKEFYQMYKDGIITEEEFNAKKAELLSINNKTE